MFDIKDFSKAVILLKNGKCRDFVTVPDLARALGARQIDILAFIDENPRLVHTEERFREKTKTVKVAGWGALRGQSWTEQRKMNGASLGLCVIDAFERIEDNPWNPEWLEKVQRDYAKTLWLSEVNNYGEILGQCFTETKKNSALAYGQVYANNLRNDWLWRNTREKLEAAKALGGCFEKTFVMGGYGDSYERREPYATDARGLEILRNAGWTIY